MTAFRTSMYIGEHLVGLEEVLDQVISADLEWHLTFFWGTPAVGADVSVDSLEEAASAAPHGLILSEEELRLLATKLYQVIDCVILGFPKDQPVHLRDSATMSVVAFDSSEWGVYAGLRERYRIRTESLLSEI
ncbi:hypothetical protein [Sanguibacter suaedae]|uniref:Uncharacterized protein n=1 Tax=Sanguibacter suaedae TaxID=2795737 RepID=A0A934M8K2_9MICO|nr:hypothetical protein [Sanguibacter suaedae]MBI9113668.1 hypothetical protein [Sanguibacter suaedae]